MARADLPASGRELPSSDPAVARIWRVLDRVLSSRASLAAMIVAYVACTATLAQLRAWELHTGTWDLGLYQQALWSWGKGRPLYESADFAQEGYASFLQVHASFVLVLVAPLYDAFPAPITLFLVQSGVVGLAALPLHRLAKDVLNSPRWATLCAALYLAWTPVIASSLFDFHGEAFLPIELFTLFWLWRGGRFKLGLVVALLSFVTLEVAPVLVASLAVFFLWPSRRGTWELLAGLRSSNGQGSAFRARLQKSVSALRSWTAVPQVRASTVLLLGSIVAYYLLRLFQSYWAVPLLGLPPVPTNSVVAGGLIGANPGLLGLSLANLSIDLPQKIEYWVLVYALLGLVPLLRPRALLLVAPWWAFTLLGTDSATVHLGYQYGFVVACPVMIGLVLGMKSVSDRLAALASAPSPASTTTHDPAWRPSSSAPHARGRSLPFLLAVFSLVVVNLALSPLDPGMQQAGFGDAYHVSYTVPPGYGAVQQVASLVPAGASVVATDDLFPLVANDLAAYSFNPYLSMYDGYLPFNSTNLPSYVLASAQHGYEVPSWIGEKLYDTSIYGVRAAVGDSPAGGVLLFQLGYTGPSTLYRQTLDAGGAWGAGELTTSTIGSLRATPGAPGGEAVWGVPGDVGQLWTSPMLSLSGGSYRFTAMVRVSALGPGSAPGPTAPVLQLGVGGFAGEPSNFSTVTFQATQPSGWIGVELNVTVTEPVIAVAVYADQLDPGAVVETAGLQLVNYPATG